MHSDDPDLEAASPNARARSALVAASASTNGCAASASDCENCREEKAWLGVTGDVSVTRPRGEFAKYQLSRRISPPDPAPVGVCAPRGVDTQQSQPGGPDRPIRPVLVPSPHQVGPPRPTDPPRAARRDFGGWKLRPTDPPPGHTKVRGSCCGLEVTPWGTQSLLGLTNSHPLYAL
eukprot:scaffold19060_cov62-Phaeocystis_antarctica.AAC.3